MASTAKQIDFLITGYRNPGTDEPLSGGKVYTYLADTTTESNLYTDRDKSAEAENPVELDAYGRAEVYGDEIYKFEMYDSSGTHIETLNNLEYTPSSKVGGRNIFIQSNQPVDNESFEGDIWIDIS